MTSAPAGYPDRFSVTHCHYNATLHDNRLMFPNCGVAHGNDRNIDERGAGSGRRLLDRQEACYSCRNHPKRDRFYWGEEHSASPKIVSWFREEPRRRADLDRWFVQMVVNPVGQEVLDVRAREALDRAAARAARRAATQEAVGDRH